MRHRRRLLRGSRDGEGTLVGVAQIADTTDEDAAPRARLRLVRRDQVQRPLRPAHSQLLGPLLALDLGAEERHATEELAARLVLEVPEAPRLDHDPPHLPVVDGAALLQQPPAVLHPHVALAVARAASSTAAAAATAVPPPPSSSE